MSTQMAQFGELLRQTSHSRGSSSVSTRRIQRFDVAPGHVAVGTYKVAEEAGEAVVEPVASQSAAATNRRRCGWAVLSASTGDGRADRDPDRAAIDDSGGRPPLAPAGPRALLAGRDR